MQAVCRGIVVGPWGWCVLHRLRVSRAQWLVCWGRGWCSGGLFLVRGAQTPGPLVSRCELPLQCGFATLPLPNRCAIHFLRVVCLVPPLSPCGGCGCHVHNCGHGCRLHIWGRGYDVHGRWCHSALFPTRPSSLLVVPVFLSADSGLPWGCAPCMDPFGPGTEGAPKVAPWVREKCRSCTKNHPHHVIFFCCQHVQFFLKKGGGSILKCQFAGLCGIHCAHCKDIFFNSSCRPLAVRAGVMQTPVTRTG